MAMSTVAQRKEMIVELLKNNEVKTVVLVGESGIGKTWTAREISKRAIKEGLFEKILWVFLHRKYERVDLVKDIGHQLCLLPIAEEWDGDDGKELTKREKDEENAEKKVNRHDLQQKISQTLKGKRFLLILDDVGSKMDEHIMSELESFLKFSPQNGYKFLITSIESISCPDFMKPLGEIQQVKPLSLTESLSLLQQHTGMMIYEVPGVKALAEAFIEKTKGLPTAVVIMAKALSHFAKHEHEELLLESDLEEAFSDNESYNITQILCTGNGMLPLGVLMDCCWHGNHFFRNRGSIHFNELIAYWMLEGYLGRVDCIEKAYEKGHHVLMELIDCHILKKVETSYVTIEESRMNLEDCHHSGYVGTACLGLANVFEDEWEGLGRTTQVDGMMKTMLTGMKGQKLRTSLLDGNFLGREDPDNFFQSEQDLQVLALFNPTFISLPHSLCCMKKLRVLVLKGCDFLEKINHTLTLPSLTVLEISGASSLIIPENFNDLFKHMPCLRSLNLSSLLIDSLPSSLYDLSELSWLILRGCSHLLELGSLSKLRKLVLLDVSGATSLKYIKDQNFSINNKLQTLNLSQTKISKLPLLQKHGELCHLSLSGCESLTRLPSIASLVCLQTLDLSGAKKFLEFQRMEKSISLKILDLSETAVESLPSKIINLRHLFLRRCSKLKVLSCTGALKYLEVLDVSGTCTLEKIEFVEHLSSLQILNLSETKITTLPSIVNLCKLRVLYLSRCSALKELQDKSFDHFLRIQKLDLSGTKIKILPSLSKCSNLRHLLLEKCTNLEELPQLESLLKLEKLNLSGISLLRKDGAKFLEHMRGLRILDLSETSLLEELPSMSNLENLQQLILRGCPSLKMVPQLESLTKLEVLDLSGTAVVSLPSLDKFSNLRQLMLRGCSSLEEFLHLELLHLLGGTVKELPYGISKLAHLEQLDMPNMKNIIEGDNGGNTECIPQDQNWCDWSISSLSAKTPRANEYRPLVSVSGSQFLQLLERDPLLWDTNFTQFHFYVHPVNRVNSNGDRYSRTFPVSPPMVNKQLDLTPDNMGGLDCIGSPCIYRNEQIFGDIHFRTREFLQFKEQRTLRKWGMFSMQKILRKWGKTWLFWGSPLLLV
ncbi:putative disease resistance protein At4g19050 [Cornus florida]|uniref:putative disease resistance protein At4g19050 n=1 Tax=Cornus florida TaxID=4283 RepID=UPI002897D2CA|nr:putative disease resistance protein At4g19050 [Cornus florida]